MMDMMRGSTAMMWSMGVGWLLLLILVLLGIMALVKYLRT
jgi:hypothetical protein